MIELNKVTKIPDGGIKIDGKEFRNLYAQVLKNKEDIARHYDIDRVIADFGIRVVGTIDTSADLPETANAYGDAYAVGTKPPYDFWVWTRPNPNVGEPDAYWLNIGTLAIPGPQGEQGPTGPTGENGENARINTVDYAGPPTYTLTDADNGRTMVIDSKGTVWLWNNGWTANITIEGAQGIEGPQGIQGIQGVQGTQGPQGPQGAPGTIYRIIGKLTSTASLPTPSEDIRANAYLVGTNVYALVGPVGGQLTWTNFGPLEFGTQLTSGGSYISTYNIDNKVNKAGDTMTGILTIVQDQPNPIRLTRRGKTYDIGFRGEVGGQTPMIRILNNRGLLIRNDALYEINAANADGKVYTELNPPVLYKKVQTFDCTLAIGDTVTIKAEPYYTLSNDTDNYVNTNIEDFQGCISSNGKYTIFKFISGILFLGDTEGTLYQVTNYTTSTTSTPQQ